ncbi:hypothetical protein [Gordonia shandongensis]|uniref:hypothetical protein n=1 Tax=Gordonia shandongensis TaxID=376351 RepID=UPI000422B639|nr:hypothetical protein [Gordonia shandongensis]
MASTTGTQVSQRTGGSRTRGIAARGIAARGIGAAAGLALTAGIAAATVGAGPADAKVYRYTDHGLTLTHSQSVFVAHNGLGNAIAAFPAIPNFIYNPMWGRTIQRYADEAARDGGCISFGISTPDDGRGIGVMNYVTKYPARKCAR